MVTTQGNPNVVDEAINLESSNPIDEPEMSMQWEK